MSRHHFLPECGIVFRRKRTNCSRIGQSKKIMGKLRNILLQQVEQRKITRTFLKMRPANKGRRFTHSIFISQRKFHAINGRLTSPGEGTVTNGDQHSGLRRFKCQGDGVSTILQRGGSVEVEELVFIPAGGNVRNRGRRRFDRFQGICHEHRSVPQFRSRIAESCKR